MTLDERLSQIAERLGLHQQPDHQDPTFDIVECLEVVCNRLDALERRVKRLELGPPP